MILTNVNTHYSLLLGNAKPDELLKKASGLGYKSVAMTDYDSLSGAVNFFKNAKKNKIKPIIGSRVKLYNLNNMASGYVNLYAKNKKGWFELIKICSALYIGDEVQVSVDELRNTSNLSCVICGTDSLEDEATLRTLKDIFKKDIFVGINYRNVSHVINTRSIEKLTAIADKLDITIIDSPLVAYTNLEDKYDHLTLYSSHLGITSPEWNTSHDQQFTQFREGEFELLEPDNMFHGKKEYVDNLKRFDELIEEYSILEKPSMPAFPCPNGMSEAEYLKQLCRDGWKRIFKDKPATEHQKIKYGDQVQHELAVINKAGLDGYFLIVQDYVNWAKNQNWLIGCGRGSAGGCLVSYLTRITSIDPIKYDLLFERFYNEGRNTADHVSFPDIDVDFPVDKRDDVIEYIRKKYGEQNVSQVVTYSSLQGRGALKEVLRIHAVCDWKTMDEITKGLPAKDKISDKLEEEKEKSIIRWVLKNEPELVKDYCRIRDDGEYEGEYATYFKQAIKLENTFKSYGKHASALVISKEPMNESCPMIREKNGKELIAAIEYTEMEELGKVKMDILGVAILTKLMHVNELLRNGVINES